MVNIETVRHFANALAGRAELEQYAECGQLVFYQEPERVLRSIAEFWERSKQRACSSSVET